MLLEELYTELLKKLDEREMFSIYARIGNLMERYKDTRDNALVEEFKNRFKHILIMKGLWEFEEKKDQLIMDFPSETIKDSYSRLNHFHDCMKRYQGKNRLRMKVEDIEHIENYFRQNYSPDTITRTDVDRVCKMLGKKSVKDNENSLLRRLNLKALDDISHLETDLLDDFKVFSKEYDILARNDLSRKKFLYSQFVLFHILRKRGHDYCPENFMMIRMDDRKRAHNEICRLIFKRPGREFKDEQVIHNITNGNIIAHNNHFL